MQDPGEHYDDALANDDFEPAYDDDCYEGPSDLFDED